MKPVDLMIRCLALKRDGGWVAICLPYDLTAFGKSLGEAKKKLEAQIVDYLTDALVGEDRKHADYLLNRRAPLKYRAMYALYSVLNFLRGGKKKGTVKYKQTVPMAPAAAAC